MSGWRYCSVALNLSLRMGVVMDTPAPAVGRPQRNSLLDGSQETPCEPEISAQESERWISRETRCSRHVLGSIRVFLGIRTVFLDPSEDQGQEEIQERFSLYRVFSDEKGRLMSAKLREAILRRSLRVQFTGIVCELLGSVGVPLKRLPHLWGNVMSKKRLPLSGFILLGQF